MINYLDNCPIYVVPGWVYRSLLRNKLNIIGKMDYNQVRKVLSIDDLAQWSYVNHSLAINKVSIGQSHLLNLFNQLSEEQSIEYKSSIDTIANLPDTQQSVLERLRTTNAFIETEYEIISNQNFILVVVNEGFLTKITDEEYLMTFVKKYLESCYAMMPIVDVSYTSMFGLYVDLIK